MMTAMNLRALWLCAEHGSRNLHQAETEEKDSRSESEYLVGEVQLASHLETGEPDVTRSMNAVM
jgi:hypothetical protein